MKSNLLVGSSAILFKKVRGRVKWLIVQQDEEGNIWSVPKTTARKGESSVRATVRHVTDYGGIDIQVLEEVGRAGGTANVNNRIVPRRTYYYLVTEKGNTEKVNFPKFDWLEAPQAVKKLESKRQASMLKRGLKLLQQLEKEKGKNYWLPEE